MKNNDSILPYISSVAAPIYYFALRAILGSLWEGYSWFGQHMSELGGVESPVKNLMNIFGFMGVGIAGIFMIIVGFFPCDAHCIDVTTTRKLHTIMSIPQSILLPLGAILAGIGFGKAAGWEKKWQVLSLLLGGGSKAAGPPIGMPEYSHLVGLIQRVGMGLSLLWVFFVSIKILFNWAKN